ncbi:MAG: hypothetical protein IKB16_06435 [Lentisphaeria bacterium]|nr:hypothetical protein [Lentisphaeria bacterium]
MFGFVKKNLIIWVFLTVFAASAVSYRQITADEFRKNSWTVAEPIRLPANWQISWNIKNPSAWTSVKIDTGLFSQGIKKRGICWYRVDFTIPEKYLNGELLLDMGYISSADITFINGKSVGSCGSFPPEKPVSGSSWMRRQYRIPTADSPFKAGKNQLVVKVLNGYLSGMYKGIPQLAKLRESCLVNYRLKEGGKYSLDILLSDAEHLNHYTPESLVMAAPEFAYISPEKEQVQARCRYRVIDSGKRVLRTGEQVFTLKNNHWSLLPVIRLGNFPVGSYTFEYILESGQKQLLAQKLNFAVAEPQKFTVPVDKKITWNGRNGRVLKDSFGHTGPRQVKVDQLVNTQTAADARGALCFSTLCSSRENAPLIFMNNIRAVPKNAPHLSYFLQHSGSLYDSFQDAWILGRISDGRQQKKSLSVVSSTWTERAWQYRYPGNMHLSFSINELSPAWRIHTGSDTVNLFDGIKTYGIGLPSRMAFTSSNGSIKVVDSAVKFSGSDMGENWILMWFNGSENWNEFDIPWLITFQRKPRSVAVGKDSVCITFSKKGAGFISGMPLYGVKLLKLQETASWNRNLPEKVAAQCRIWSSILASAPKNVLRSISQDFKGNEMKIRDQFFHFPIRDEWNTKALKIAPISPVLVLAADSGNIPIRVNHKNRDLSLSTLHGPYVAVPEAQEVIISVKGLSSFVSEIRKVEIPTGKEVEKLRRELADRTKSFMNRISEHPWQEMFWRNRWFVPGNVEQPALANVILLTPYLPEDIKKQVSSAIQTEMEKYVVREGKPDDELKKHLGKTLKDKELSFTVKGFSGKEMTSFQSRQNMGGVDGLCIESFRLYTIWLYCNVFNRFDFADRHWELLLRLYNWIPNSHDWGICVSWDSFCGLRVGNGLQESSLAHAGAAAMARLAHRKKNFKLRDKAAYFAVMQLIGMQGALNANTYLRSQRPWPSTHSRAVDMEYTEKTRAKHYSEFNEFGGISQNIIRPRALLNAASSFILTSLPETMRPYKEIWHAATDDFFTPSQIDPNGIGHRPISVDHYLYMTTSYPKSFKEVWSERDKNARLFEWFLQLADIRAAIEYYGKIHWQKLW